MAPAAQRVVLLACGSFNPPTIMHLRIFELAKDYFKTNVPHCKVVGGVMSPTHDVYKKHKSSLISSQHRLAMARLAAKCADWVEVSDWEVKQEDWSRTRHVLDMYTKLASSSTPMPWLPHIGSLEQGPICFKLLCGADLLESFSVPGLWNEDDLTAIVRDYGIVVISREGSNPEKFIYESDLLTQYKHNIHLVTEWIGNEVSSTKIRTAVRRGNSVKYLVPDSVIDYITENKLYV